MSRIIRSNSETNFLKYKKIINSQNNNLLKLKIVCVNKEYNLLRRRLSAEKSDINLEGNNNWLTKVLKNNLIYHKRSKIHKYSTNSDLFKLNILKIVKLKISYEREFQKSAQYLHLVIYNYLK